MENKRQVPLFKVFMPPEADAAVLETLHSGYLAEGERVKEFRGLLQKFLGNEFVVPMNNCTMALTIAYYLAGVRPGDEVISTPLTCVATNIPLVQLGAKIVWADCEPNTGMIDPNKLEELITPRTKAIVVLHKDGDLARLAEISAIATKHNLKLIEDAAHTLGAKYQDKAIGNWGDFTCFSLQAIKHITTADGGLLVCKNAADYARAKKMKWLGADKESVAPGVNVWREDIALPGYKANMNDLSATIGIAQMPHLPEILEKFHQNGLLYDELLKNIEGVELVPRDPKNYAVYWTYVLLVRNREKLISALAAAGVAAGVVHPRNDQYSLFASFRRALPGVDAFAERELSLPCGWWVTATDIKKIVQIIKENI